MEDTIVAEFEMTDDLASRIAREGWLAFGRRLFTPWTMISIALSVAFYLLVRFNSSPQSKAWVLLSIIAPAFFALLIASWLVGLWWLPRHMRKKISHLPHRTVRIEFTSAEFGVNTATEQIRLRWSEVTELRELRDTLFFKLRAGSEIPVPRSALPSGALEQVRLLISSR